MASPTMQDIADAAGVAQSTVSRVLNGGSGPIGVAEETRRRVRAIADELGYRPHPFARALRGAPSMLLGAVVRSFSDPFFAEAIHAVSIEAKRQGYSLVLGHAAHGSAHELSVVLEVRQCDAIVVLGDLGDAPQLLEDLRRLQVRVVALWHGASLEGFPSVGVDNRAGTDAVLRHLIGLGHERIAFVGPELLGDVRERQAAYEEALNRAGIAVPSGYVDHVANTIAGAEQAFARLWALPQRPTAIVAATDLLAISLLHSAHRRGLSIPGQLSIAGFDDIPFAAAAVPGLTTVRMPVAEIVAAAVGLAVGSEASEVGGDRRSERVVFEPQLVVRGSTAAPALNV
jgi:DNA-binding LacI/PurR family transcriptional regulator